MDLTWQTNPEASCWHALLANAFGAPMQDTQLAAMPACDAQAARQAAIDWCESESAPAEEGVAAALEYCRQKIAPPADELRLRQGPLREQWDARGPGLMKALARLTEPTLGGAATIHLVTPVVGGHGVALADARSVFFEAVLANPNAELPEVLRLGWLLAQLDSPSEAAPLALVPAVLAAGNDVELAPEVDGPTVEQALVAWRAAENPISTASILTSWWRDYRASLSPWAAALSDLKQRLS